MATNRWIRVSDQNRLSAAELLSETYAVGRLSRAELDERLARGILGQDVRGTARAYGRPSPSGGANRSALRHRGFAARAAEAQPTTDRPADMDLLCARAGG
jgi:hypothetical protein